MNGIQLAGIDWAILCIYFAFALGYLAHIRLFEHTAIGGRPLLLLGALLLLSGQSALRS